MAIVKKISVDNLSGSPEERDIGAEAQNVSYSEEESVKDKLDQHEEHTSSSIISENGVHGLRIHDDILQSYNETEEEWIPVSTGYDVPAGGATNQGLVKASAGDNDTTWADVLLKNGSVAADNITVGSRRSDVTTGLESLAMGPNNAAAGRGAQAQGASNNASGNYSHAEGQSSSASGVAAHAEGNYTVATGSASHAEGDHTEAGYAGQHVTGKYNDNKEDTLFEVGNGTLDNARSNAFEVTNDGYIRTHGNNVKIAFGIDSNGKYGYIKEGADTVIPFKGDPNLQSKTVSPSTSSQTVTPDSNYDGLSQVTVNAISMQSKNVTPSTSSQTIRPDSNYDGLSSVTVNAIQTQTKSVTPSTSSQTVTPDSGKFLSSVSVGAISTQTKTATLTGSQHSVTPDNGKYLSSVTIPAVVGTATAASVLSSATFSSASNPTGATGSIATRSASSEIISAAKTYSAGYYPTQWIVTPIIKTKSTLIGSNKTDNFQIVDRLYGRDFNNEYGYKCISGFMQRVSNYGSTVSVSYGPICFILELYIDYANNKYLSIQHGALYNSSKFYYCRGLYLRPDDNSSGSYEAILTNGDGGSNYVSLTFTYGKDSIGYYLDIYYRQYVSWGNDTYMTTFVCDMKNDVR